MKNLPIKIARTVDEIRDVVSRARSAGHSIGLVPTMGALHEGHASLIRAARRECGFVVVSIFVNPIQFGPAEDLDRYPRTPEHDLRVCEDEAVNAIFMPEAKTVYPPGFCTAVEVHRLQDGLCGRSRPGHFRGVATVVLKLFNMVQPDAAYFGQKDAQQTRIIQRLVRDLDVPVQVKVCPIIREADGLALSSRNRYLEPDQRRRAAVLYHALEESRVRIESGERDAGKVRQAIISRIASTPGAELDYVEIVDVDSLQPLSILNGEILIAVAVKFGSTRLIDNLQMCVAHSR